MMTRIVRGVARMFQAERLILVVDTGHDRYVVASSHFRNRTVDVAARPLTMSLDRAASRFIHHVVEGAPRYEVVTRRAGGLRIHFVVWRPDTNEFSPQESELVLIPVSTDTMTRARIRVIEAACHEALARQQSYRQAVA